MNDEQPARPARDDYPTLVHVAPSPEDIDQYPHDGDVVEWREGLAALAEIDALRAEVAALREDADNLAALIDHDIMCPRNAFGPWRDQDKPCDCIVDLALAAHAALVAGREGQ